MASSKTRAPKVPAPGAKRLTLTGVMAVPDDYGRVRVLLMDPLPGGLPDRSWAILQNEAPVGYGDHAPYVLHPGGDEGARGEFWAVAPARRKEHWLKVAGELRGQEVRVEVTVRPYSYAGHARMADKEGAHLRGLALDIAMIEPLALAAAPASRGSGK